MNKENENKENEMSKYGDKKKLVKINGYWIDENNNKWNCSFYTEEEAEKCSKSLISCRDCTNCRDCKCCKYCTNCKSCRDCRYCAYCTDCRNNGDCISCRGCTDCRNSRGCTDCKDCVDCIGCRDCTNCRNSRDCEDCRGCTDCRNCKGFDINPMRLVSGHIGSRQSQTVVYWNCDVNLVVCGCFIGTLLEFEKKVKEKHKDNIQYLDEYMRFIDLVWINIENNN